METFLNKIKLFLLVALSLSGTLFATSPNTNEEKVSVYAFFIIEEIPTIGNFPLAQLQMVQWFDDMLRVETTQPELISYYVAPPHEPMWRGAY